MTRINTNVNSLIAKRVLGLNNQALNQSLERLSTGLRINRGKDDPAGLIAWILAGGRPLVGIVADTLAQCCDRVVAIETTYSFYSTEKGLCVGTALDPIRLRREFDNYIKERYLKGEVVLTPGLELELDDDVKVSKIVVVPVG